MRLAHFRGTGVCSYTGVACIANMASPGLLLEVNNAVRLRCCLEQGSYKYKIRL